MFATESLGKGDYVDKAEKKIVEEEAIAAQYEAQQLAIDNWPMNSLKCMSSLTKPDMKLICPAARSTWCVKEVSDLRQDLCGDTQFFGDMWVNAMCEFKKCSDVCVPGTTSFTWGNNKYKRRTYCCNDKDFCNSSSKLKTSLLITSIAVILVILTFGF